MTTLVEAAPAVSVLTGSRRLAVLRIVAGLVAVYQAVQWWGYPVPPEGLRFPPRYFDFTFLPVNTALFTVAVAVLFVGGICVAAGWHHRVWGWIAAAGFFYAGFVTTLTGKVNHNHHILWFLILITVAPAASVWAVRREPVRGSVNWAVTGFCVVLGLIYFSAGLGKLRGGGFGWGADLADIITSANTEKGLPAAPDWMRGPVVGPLMGTGALAFELLFLPFLVWPRTRRWVWPAGVVFHWSTWWLMGISFATLWPFYAVLLPWQEGSETAPSKLQERTTIVLVTFVAVFALVGVGGGWPFAAYPAFGQPFEPRLVLVDGEPLWTHPISAAQGRAAAVFHAVNALRAGRTADYADWIGVDRVVLGGSDDD